MEPVFPLPRLIIAGAGHIGKALSHLGCLLDFEVTVIDSRLEFANNSRLPDADYIITGNIGELLKKQHKDRNTYIVIVTRGHSDDAEALSACIGSPAAYIGMIGSKPKVALMKKKFIEEGLASEAEWSSIHTPIGLDIGSKTVNEIAVSIAAQLVKLRREAAKV
jgi:xanthine dehydrogenase accessory factor